MTAEDPASKVVRLHARGSPDPSVPEPAPGAKIMALASAAVQEGATAAVLLYLVGEEGEPRFVCSEGIDDALAVYLAEAMKAEIFRQPPAED